MTHGDAVNLVLMELSRHGCMPMRYFSGMVPTARGDRYRVGTPGAADIIGCTGDGRAIAVEVKVGRDRVRPHQAAWAAAWLTRGALYAEVRPDTEGWQLRLCELLACVQCHALAR